MMHSINKPMEDLSPASAGFFLCTHHVHADTDTGSVCVVAMRSTLYAIFQHE